jgi:hypothetical protein
MLIIRSDGEKFNLWCLCLCGATLGKGKSREKIHECKSKRVSNQWTYYSLVSSSSYKLLAGEMCASEKNLCTTLANHWGGSLNTYQTSRLDNWRSWAAVYSEPWSVNGWAKRSGHLSRWLLFVAQQWDSCHDDGKLATNNTTFSSAYLANSNLIFAMSNGDIYVPIYKH